MILVVILVAFLFALLRGGRPRTDLQIRGLWVAPVALLLQAASQWAPGETATLIMVMVSYLMLIYVLARNSRYQSLRLLLLGVVLNFLVMAANGGRIPVDAERARHIGMNTVRLLTGVDPKHVVMTEHSVLSFLGDVIPVTFPVARMISIGDICVMLGTFILIQEFMGKRIVIGTTAE